MSYGPGSQTRSVEWLLAACMMAWGFGLLMPGDTMQLANYRHLGAVASEAVWAGFSLGVGMARLVALYVNGEYFRTPLIRAVGAVLGMIWWAVLGVLFFTAARDGPVPAALLFYPVFMGFEAYSAYRSARDSYHTGALRKPWHPIQMRR